MLDTPAGDTQRVIVVIVIAVAVVAVAVLAELLPPANQLGQLGRAEAQVW